MLHEFLEEYRDEVLEMTEKKTLELAGTGPSSDQLKLGLPIFYEQLLDVLQLGKELKNPNNPDTGAMAKAADDSDEEALALAGMRPDEAVVAKSAGLHGTELLRLGYTLSHVVHAYGAMCQSITELATNKKITITTDEFHDLNRCLDIGIAGAVTGYVLQRNMLESSREIQHLGSLAHELRNSLTSANLSLQIIEKGTVGVTGNTGQVLKKSLKRIGELVDRSLTEVRLRLDPKLHVETGNLRQLVDQLLITAEVEAHLKNQTIEIKIEPNLIIEADQQLFYSGLSNLIQNAIKYTHTGGKIQVRGLVVEENVIIEVEDECGGLSNDAESLFKAFEQQDEDRSGLGLGLTIAQRSIKLNHGKLEVHNLPKKGCIFKITLPKHTDTEIWKGNSSSENSSHPH